MIDFLAASNITKYFGGVAALTDVSISIGAGDSLALLGGNGAGKSTLVSILAGLNQPDSGVVRVDGQVRSFHGPHEARAAGIETVFQNLALCGNLDAPGNLFLGRELFRGVGPFKFLDRRGMNATTAQTLANLGVRIPDLAVATASYSGGQRQALSFARAARAESRLLILDEPTAALGVEESTNVVATIQRLRRERGMGVLLITHNLEEMRALADRAVVLRRGRLVGDVLLSETSDDQIVSMITGSSPGTVR